jgi:hypothetical protein
VRSRRDPVAVATASKASSILHSAHDRTQL